jgi:hypothetical protein
VKTRKERTTHPADDGLLVVRPQELDDVVGLAARCRSQTSCVPVGPNGGVEACS